MLKLFIAQAILKFVTHLVGQTPQPVFFTTLLHTRLGGGILSSSAIKSDVSTLQLNLELVSNNDCNT